MQGRPYAGQPAQGHKGGGDTTNAEWSTPQRSSGLRCMQLDSLQARPAHACAAPLVRPRGAPPSCHYCPDGRRSLALHELRCHPGAAQAFKSSAKPYFGGVFGLVTSNCTACVTFVFCCTSAEYSSAAMPAEGMRQHGWKFVHKLQVTSPSDQSDADDKHRDLDMQRHDLQSHTAEVAARALSNSNSPALSRRALARPPPWRRLA
jgi:hypothetical protein